jgi:signal transduction histidine kinase/CheY-like chemotaxis protein
MRETKASFLPSTSSLAFKIPFAFIIIVLLFILSFLLVMEFKGKPLLRDLTDKRIKQTGESIVAQLGKRIELTESLVTAMANVGETLPNDEATYRSVIPNLINYEGTENFLAGGGIWPEPFMFTPDVEKRSFFWGRSLTNKLEYFDDYNSPAGSGYHYEEWYVPASLLKPGQIYWSRSYMDPYSYQSMVTATAPMFKNGHFFGATTIDIKLEGLSQLLEQEAKKLGGYAFALDRNGTFLSFPDSQLTKRFDVDKQGNKTEEYLNIKDLASSSNYFKQLVNHLTQLEKRQPLSIRGLNQADQITNRSYQIEADEAKSIVRMIEDTLSNKETGATFLTRLHIEQDPIFNESVVLDVFHVPDTYWKVITVVPEQQAYATIGKIINAVQVASVGVLLFSVFIGFYMIRRAMLKPVLSMAKQVEAFDLSTLEKKESPAIEIQNQDELGELAQQFNSVTSKLLESKQKLEQQIELSEQAAIAKSQFLANMSHEIRTPINGVMGMLTLLNHTEQTRQQQHYTSMARTSTDSLLTVINDILDFSKIEAGKLDIEIIDFDLRSLLEEFAGSIAFTAQKKGLELVLDINQVDHQMVKGDPGRIKQVLTNLVSNAIKFTARGEVVIRVHLKDAGEMGLLLYGSVSDTGIGIPKEKQQSLFQSFSQVDASNTREYGGTGLGLAISKQLCELMGGSISLISEHNKGSQFDFTLCLQSSNKALHELPKVNLEGHQILIVDDNKTNRAVMKGQLENWGAIVTEASSGQDALSLLSELSGANTTHKSPFEVAILDMQMPHMNGAELGKAIREITLYDDMKLIMMTSMGERGDANYFANLGFSAYFPKPAATQDIYDALSVVIEGGEALTNATPLVTHHHLRSLQRQQVKHEGKILLVEDNLINQQVALGILESLGYKADAAGNGQEALHYINTAPKDKPYSLILMDCQMPVMDGYEATQAIRAKEKETNQTAIPILALTANAMKGDMERCISVGMNDYLSKPINPTQLQEKLDLWFFKLAGKAKASTYIKAADQ